jgi:hypothetical protein
MLMSDTHTVVQSKRKLPAEKETEQVKPQNLCA